MPDNNDISKSAEPDVKDPTLVPRPKYTGMSKATYHVGDEVYIRTGSDYKGPYLVSSVVNSGVCTLSDYDGNDVLGKAQYHSRDLKLAQTMHTR